MNLFLGFADAVVGGAFLAFIGWLLIWSRRRSLRLFWKGFDGKVVVMATEYRVSDPESTALDQNANEIEFQSDQHVAALATSRLFVSVGMARSIALFWKHFEGRWRSHVEVISDKADAVPVECKNLIILGSSANNDYLQHFFPLFGLEYPLLNRFQWKLSAHGVILELPDGTQLVPSVDDSESGLDYAFVARFPLVGTDRARMVIISGCNMWGTLGASEFLLNHNALKMLPRTAKHSSSPIAFALQIRVYRGRPDAVTLCKAKDGSAQLFNLTRTQDAAYSAGEDKLEKL